MNIYFIKFEDFLQLKLDHLMWLALVGGPKPE